jgi:energy-coupling factor transport system substrate-specific component
MSSQPQMRPTAASIPRVFLATALPVAISINLVIGLLVHALKLPLYLDSIGTVFIGFTLGPWWAAVVGASSMFLGGLLLNPWMPYYAGTAVLIGLISGFWGRLGWQRSITKATALGVVLALAAAVASAPVTVLVFGGVTGSGTTTLVAILRASGKTLVQSVLITGFAVEILDKVITCVVPALMVRSLPKVLAARFPLLNR